MWKWKTDRRRFYSICGLAALLWVSPLLSSCTHPVDGYFRTLRIQRLFFPVKDLKLVDAFDRADILFILDNSGSMAVHQNHLREAMRTFSEVYLTAETNVCVGFLTSYGYRKHPRYAQGGPYYDPNVYNYSSPGPLGLLDGRSFCTQDENGVPVDLDELREDLDTLFSSEISADPSKREEKLYESLWWYLESTEKVADSEHFFRPSTEEKRTARYIITVTDEEEQTGALDSEGIVATGSYYLPEDLACPFQSWSDDSLNFEWRADRCPMYSLWEPAGIVAYVRDFFENLDTDSASDAREKLGIVSVSIQELVHLIEVREVDGCASNPTNQNCQRYGALKPWFDRCKRCEDISDLASGLSFKVNITEPSYFDAFLNEIGLVISGTERFFEFLLPYPVNENEGISVMIREGEQPFEPLSEEVYQVEPTRIVFDSDFVEGLTSQHSILIEYFPSNLGQNE